MIFFAKPFFTRICGIFFENLKVGTLLAYIVIQSLKRLKKGRLKGYKMSRPAGQAFISKSNDAVGQALSLLETLQSQQSGRMVRISSELSNALADENNFKKIQNAKNLDELLDTMEGFELENTMLKVPCEELLRATYPSLAKRAFL